MTRLEDTSFRNRLDPLNVQYKSHLTTSSTAYKQITEYGLQSLESNTFRSPPTTQASLLRVSLVAEVSWERD